MWSSTEEEQGSMDCFRRFTFFSYRDCSIVIILLVSCGPDQSTPKDAVDSFLEAVSDKDQEDIIETIYPPLVSEYGSSLEAYYDILEDTLSEFDTTNVTTWAVNLSANFQKAPEKTACFSFICHHLKDSCKKRAESFLFSLTI